MKVTALKTKQGMKNSGWSRQESLKNIKKNFKNIFKK
jgi:hypothetical protein